MNLRVGPNPQGESLKDHVKAEIKALSPAVRRQLKAMLRLGLTADIADLSHEQRNERVADSITKQTKLFLEFEHLFSSSKRHKILDGFKKAQKYLTDSGKKAEKSRRKAAQIIDQFHNAGLLLPSFTLAGKIAEARKHTSYQRAVRSFTVASSKLGTDENCWGYVVNGNNRITRLPSPKAPQVN